MKLYTILPEGLKDLFFKMFLKWNNGLN
jgi:hypothetical protein